MKSISKRMGFGEHFYTVLTMCAGDTVLSSICLAGKIIENQVLVCNCISVSSSLMESYSKDKWEDIDKSYLTRNSQVLTLYLTFFLCVFDGNDLAGFGDKYVYCTVYCPYFYYVFT